MSGRYDSFSDQQQSNNGNNNNNYSINQSSPPRRPPASNYSSPPRNGRNGRPNDGRITEDNYGGMRNDFMNNHSMQDGFQNLEGNNNNNNSNRNYDEGNRGDGGRRDSGDRGQTWNKRDGEPARRPRNVESNNGRRNSSNPNRRSASPELRRDSDFRRDSESTSGGGRRWAATTNNSDNGWGGNGGRETGRNGSTSNRPSPYPLTNDNNRFAQPSRPRSPPRKSRGSNAVSSAPREGPAPGEDPTEYILGRTKQERPCRTLFVRNLKFAPSFPAPSEEVRTKFERMGEVKTFFDLIVERGMVFVTYYDIRAAMLAKESLQGIEVEGRAMDVHYSLPREIDLKKRCDRDRSQGTLSLRIPNSTASIDDAEVRARFGTCGDINSILPDPKHPADRLVEFWDCRGCGKAYDELNGQVMAGGTMDLAFEWDTLPPPISNPTVHIDPPVKSSFTSGSNSQRTQAQVAREQQAAAPAVPSLDDRMSQALRVQQMLSSLAAVNAPPPPAAQPVPDLSMLFQPSPAAASSQYSNYAPLPNQPQPGGYGNSGYGPPPSQFQGVPQYNYGLPPPSAINQYNIPPPSSAISPLPAQSTVPSGNISLPAPLLALLSSTRSPPPPAAPSYQQPSYTNSNSYIPPGENVYAQPAPPQSQSQPITGSATSSAAQVQSLLALLAQQQRN